MDFDEANKYQERNKNVIGQYLFDNKPHKIETLFIVLERLIRFIKIQRGGIMFFSFLGFLLKKSPK